MSIPCFHGHNYQDLETRLGAKTCDLYESQESFYK